MIEEEGDLGCTDVFVALGLARTFAWATLSAELRLPVRSDVEGAQLDLPYIARLGLSR